MKPVIAIVGRPNVGKSTLFNRLTASRDALVADRPGVTRDRQYGISHHHGRTFLAVDTGGIGETDHDSGEVAELITEQALQASAEAGALIWIVDGRTGLTQVDETLAGLFRRLDKPVFLAVNKIEGREPDTAISEFYALGFASIYPVSTKRGDGITDMLDAVMQKIVEPHAPEQPGTAGLSIAVLGRPNVGKSTLINRMLGEERMLTFDRPGTTRDSIRIPFQKNNKDYILIDTAGVRRKSRVHDTVEKFSVIKSFAAIERARIVILVIDAGAGVTEQDSALLGMIEDGGKSVIIAVNKWDGLQTSDRERVKAQLSRKFSFIDYAQYHYISALHGAGIGPLFKTINKIEKSSNLDVSASELTGILEEVIGINPPQIVRGRRIKLRYAHLGGQNPIRIIIHGNRTDSVPNNYKRYLAKSFSKRLKLVGTPVLIEFKRGHNPYKDKKNTLTQRQINKRRRLLNHVKRR